MPLFVFDGNDLSVYWSVDELCGDLEAFDVDDGVFESFDGDGYPLELLTSGYSVVGVQIIEGGASMRGALTDRVRDHARAVLSCRSHVDIETADLSALADMIRTARPEPFRFNHLIPARLRRAGRQTQAGAGAPQAPAAQPKSTDSDAD